VTEGVESETAAPAERHTRALVLSLVLGGLVLTAVAVAVGLIVDPVFFALAAFSLVDFLLAWMFATGRIGPGAARRKAEAAGAAGDAATAAQADPAYNPYARED
jgi:hypothetical protein